MKKIGILILIVTVVVGVAVANAVSFGKASGNIFTFSFGSKINGSGVAASESRPSSEFSGVEVGGVFQVEITAGKEYSIQVQADDNLLPYVKTEVDSGVLKISTTERISGLAALAVRRRACTVRPPKSTRPRAPNCRQYGHVERAMSSI